MEGGALQSLLNMTAQRMEAPELFGSFHITAALITAAAALAAAVFTVRRSRNRPDPSASLISVLAAAGWVLALLELYKQLFLYHVVNGGVYDWWYFPFQLCSVPMYLCVLLPFARGRLRRAFLTFMGGYTFISALAALIFPEDILGSTYVSLIMHGFIWHGILLFVSLVIMLEGAADAEARPAGSACQAEGGAGAGLSAAIRDAACLFAVLSVIAVLINMAAEPAMQAASAARSLPHSYAAMFYMNPYHISPQPIVSSVQKTAGIPAGLMLYALAIAAAGSAVTAAACRLRRRFY